MTTNIRQGLVRSGPNVRQLAEYGATALRADDREDARYFIAKVGGEPSTWFQALSDRDTKEEPLAYGMTSPTSSEDLQQLRNILSAIQYLSQELQEIIDSYLTTGTREYEMASGWTAEFDERSPFGSEAMMVTASESAEQIVILDVRRRISVLMEQLVGQLLLLMGSYKSYRSSMALVGGLQNLGISVGTPSGYIGTAPPDWQGIQSTKEEFDRLADEWINDRPRGVDLADMAMHPAYQQIIGMGPTAVPWLLERLENNLDHWFWALNAITRSEDVVPDESSGDLIKMANTWLSWGERRGITR